MHTRASPWSLAFPAPSRRRAPSRRGSCDAPPNMAESLSMERREMIASPAEGQDASGMRAAEAELRACFAAGLAGDAAGYRQFLDGLSGHLRAYLRRRLPRARADVEDILQETLL